MFKNYFLSVFRNLKRKKFYTFINVTGLSIGICSSILIYLILSFEFSFDNYQPHKNQTYRTIITDVYQGNVDKTPAVPYPLPEYLRANFTDIKYLSIIDANFGDMLVSVKNKKGDAKRFIEEKGVCFVGNYFFNIFHYDWLFGDASTAFSKTNSAVISESLARKYFGDENPIGKTLTLDNKHQIEITGLVKDPPANTDFPFKLIISYDNYKPKRYNDNWTSLSSAIQCIITLKEGADVKEFEKAINPPIQKHMNDKGDGERYSIGLQPLNQIHFNVDCYSFSDLGVNKQKLYALGIIGLLILILSCINYINLNTALMSGNSVEIGIRKVLGGTGKQIFMRFLLETTVITVISFAVSLIYLELFTPAIENITGFNLNIGYTGIFRLTVFIALTLFFMVAIGGGYPAFKMSRFNPISAVKNKLNFNPSRRRLSLRNVLVVFQFGTSQALIIATLIVISQINFIRSTDMGFDKTSVLEVPLPENDSLKVATFRNELKQNTMIRNVSFSSTGTASPNTWGGTAVVKKKHNEAKLVSQIKFADADYLKTYSVRLLAGENLKRGSGSNSFIVNQEFVKKIGLRKSYDEALGLRMKIWGVDGVIIGVIKDFHASNLHKKIEPLVVTNAKNRFYKAGIKLVPGNTQKEIDIVKTAWLSVYPDNVFTYDFLSTTIDKFYTKDNTTLKFLYIFSGLAILLACLGLFGLISFLTVNRTKEVGIRKVLGASIPSLLGLLSKNFLLLVLIANLISWPVAYYFMNKWLEDFAYKINIGVSFFILTTVLSIVIAFLTILYQALKVANSNPVKALRYE